MTQADDDAVAGGGPPPGGPVRAPVPPQAGPVRAPAPTAAGGPPAYFQPPYYGPPQQYGWRPPPVPLAPDGRPLADFGTRLLAHLIDGAILGGIAMLIFFPVMFLLFFRMTPDLTDPTAAPPSEQLFGDFFVTILLVELGFVIFLLAAYYVYFVEMMYRSGQTVGKKLMKIQVTPIEPGARLTRLMAAKRYLIAFPAGIVVPLFSWLDGLWQLWDKPYQQTLHDKFAKTVVVKVGP